MDDMEQLINIAEVCNMFNYENNITSLDVSEISCLTCKNWEGKKCSIKASDKFLSNIKNPQ